MNKYRVVMEVCVDSYESAIQAEKGGAIRLELCSALFCGGLTPTVGLLKVVKSLVKIPVFVMLRSRSGDFMYSKNELEIIKTDALILKENGADGFVFGALLEEGCIDVKSCEEIKAICEPLPITFHRAIDVSKNPINTIPPLISMGFDRILTSGGKATAFEGCNVIKEMIKKYGNKIIVVPGSGITKYNLEELLKITGAKEFHGSASIGMNSKMSFINPNVSMGASSDYVRKICSAEEVFSMVGIHKNLYKS